MRRGGRGKLLWKSITLLLVVDIVFTCFFFCVVVVVVVVVVVDCFGVVLTLCFVVVFEIVA